MEFPEQYTIFAVIAPIAILFTAAVTLYVWRRREMWEAPSLIGMLVIVLGWLIFNTAELVANTETLTLLATRLAYPFISLAPVAWLLFALHYSQLKGALKPRYLIVYSAIPVITGILGAMASPLLWHSPTFFPVGNMLALRIEHGPWFMVHVLWTYPMIIIAAILVIRKSLRSFRVYQRQSILIVVGVMIPLLTNVVYLLNLIPNLVKDYTPISFALSGIAFALGIFRYGLFDITPIARDVVFERMEDAVLTVDTQGRIVDLNPTALDLFPVIASNAIGQPLSEIMPAWAEWAAAQNILEIQDRFQTEVVLDVDGSPRDFSVKISTLNDPGGRRTGWVVLLHDISIYKESQRQQARLAMLEERERIGRDLHDDLGQVIAYFNVQTQAVQRLLQQEKTEQAETELAKLVGIAREGQQDVRRYILGMRRSGDEGLAETMPRPSIVGSGDFLTSLSRYLAALLRQYGLEVELHIPEEVPDRLLSPETEMQLLRIIQEGLTNVRKHAGVEQARLYILIDPDWVRVTIEDQGVGFEPSDPGRGQKESIHFGLEIMRERAELVGGTVTYKSQPGGGTRVMVRMPRLLSPLASDPTTYAWRVLLVDDHPLFRDGLRTLLTARGLNVVGVAVNGLDAQEQARNLLPDVILMDVDMPICNGIDAARQIKTELPDIRIVMLTVSADDETLFAALQVGASGYLLKDMADDDFYRLLTNIMHGETALSPQLATRILAEFGPSSPSPQGKAATIHQPAQGSILTELTERQQQVLDLAAQGLTYDEIGRKLHLSERTVRYHMGNIVEALQVKNRREAVGLARKQGLGQ